MIKEIKEKKVETTQILEDVVSKTFADKISIKDLITAMDAGGFGLIMTIFSLPILIPLPPPFPSLVSIPMMIFSFQMMIGFHSPKLPKKLSNLSIKRHILATMIEKSAPYIRKAETIVRPRLLIFSSDWFHQIIGFFCFMFSLSVLIPVPLSNFIPGMGVLIASFGVLRRDGVMILIGLLLGCLGIVITIIALLLGVEAFGILKNWVLTIF
ncbi:MAG: hypothetical protein ACJAZX_001511 [Rickettsiales bacterium]